ncbi:MAG: hypothetical protein K9J13_03875 [Saprospiraceae bacterium]|nr:hypothetical protein [Saprospiraceae bacterium]
MKLRIILIITLFAGFIIADVEMDKISSLLTKGDRIDAYTLLQNWQPQSNLQNFYYNYAQCALRFDKDRNSSTMKDALEHIGKAYEFMKADFTSARLALKNFVDSLSDDDKDMIRNYEHSRWHKPADDFLDMNIEQLDSENYAFFITYYILVNLEIQLPEYISEKYLLLSNDYAHYLYELYPIFDNKISNFSGWDDHIESLEKIMVFICDMICIQPNVELMNDFSYKMGLAIQNNPFFDNQNFKSKFDYIILAKHLLPEFLD